LDRKKKLCLLTVFILSLSVIAGAELINFGSSTYVPWVWHNSGIFIQSDGTIEPSDAPIQQLGNEYTLKTDIYTGIAVERSNAIIDGNGHKLLGSYYGTGLLLQNASNVIIQNVDVEYFGQGIYFDNSNNSIVRSSTLKGCGVDSFQSSNNQVTGNNIGGDISIDFSNNNTITSNTASSISISWSTNTTVGNNKIADSKIVDSQLTSTNYTEGIYLDNSINSVIIGNNIARKNVGIDIWQSLNSTLTSNSLTDDQVGFKLWGADLQHNLQNIDVSNSVNGKPVYFLVNITNYQVPNNAGWIAAVNCSNITVKNWISTPNWDGILFVNTENSQIVNSVISNNYNAIRFDQVSNSNITQNTISNNHNAALYFEATFNCTITNNEVSNNYFLFDIWHSSTKNNLYHNDFLGNQTGILENESSNLWDNGEEGNYWSSFTGVDLNHNGISDTPFNIDSYSNQTDNYPLMAPRNNQTVIPQNTQNYIGTVLAMPEEYINYTVSNSNGTLWAKVDGKYPIHVSNNFSDGLPMLYPIPPDTINIHVLLNGAEMNWSNYTIVDSTALHHTDIGDWQMIYCQVNPTSSDFLLEIHYEHPIQIINGSYTFLYDLNISPYLSPSSIKSTAHFNIQLIQLPTNASILTVFTTGSDDEWNSVNFTSGLGSTTETGSFNIVSEYNVTLPGDIAMVLSSSTVPEFSTWVVFPLIVAVTLGIAVFYKRSRR
jgi:parallel beta-helix repeat protein